ncbi:MAG: hypothetical protein ACD_10C00717G0002 [uncultured bacterium]|nr:MAG: hypothetical protein ACD_10C00717G0002 [uncultured bacterium]
MCRRDCLELAGDPGKHLLQTFAMLEVVIGIAPLKSSVTIGMLRPGFIVGQPFKSAITPFAHFRRRLRLKAKRQTDRLRRRPRPFEVAAIKRDNASRSKPAPGTCRLTQTRGVELDVDLPLNTARRIPFRFAVAHQAKTRYQVCRDFHHGRSISFAVNFAKRDFSINPGHF